ncbi:protein kinase domain-containing protein [Methanococcus aeolicus]|uniref:protein kinase domain-containing protein n=1 Tax=Methanococcus aeolicus TaxID=42879 RepID=UPI0021C8A422|nr:protein kinase [Methanococcus aeolicus]UXM84176.1 protein kinase [Methanococcus aeolicus]
MKKIIFVLLLLFAISMNYGEAGEPDLVVYTSITPNPIDVGHSGKLTITVKEIGGEDWAKDVVLKAYSTNDGIDISPYKSPSKDINKYGSSTFTFDIDVDKATPIGKKQIILELDYKETGVMDLGIYSHSKKYTINFNVIPDYGSLYVESNPSGAEVYINGYNMGTTPLEIPNILPNSYVLKITKDEYKEYLKEIYISPGSSKTVNAKLTPKFGYLTIYTSSGAKVYIDDKYVGYPPIRQYELYEGQHTVKITKDGYNDYTEDVYISAGGSKTIKANLESIPIVANSNGANSNGANSNGANSNGANSNGSAIILMILLIVGLIAVGGGAYFITRKKKSKTDNSKVVKNNAKKEKLTPKTAYKSKPTTVTTQKIKNSKPINNISDFPSELLNKYTPLEKLGEGGFGKVFKVKRRGGTKPIALKVPNIDKKAKKYLLKEIKAWQNLNHPNIVKMYDAYEEPTPHIEMEYVKGYNLNGKSVKDLDDYPKPVNPKEAINLIKQMAEGLKHAHNKNIIHRDIKPSNILLTQNLKPKITDWGLAKVGTKSSTATTTKGLTLLYAAPEQLDEDAYGKTDKRTDIYQLGLIFYELLTGKMPYDGTSPSIISMKLINPDLKPKAVSHYNDELAKYDCIFEKLLAKKKEDRFQSVDEFLNALNNLIELEKERAHLRESVEKTKTIMAKTTNKLELQKLQSKMVKQLCKNAVLNAELNNKVELLNILDELNDIVKREDNKKELDGAINEIEYRIKEGIPLGRDTVDKLKVLINRVEKEWE